MIIPFDICHANGTLVLLVHPALWFRREQLIDAINMKAMTTIEHTDGSNGQRDLAYRTLVYNRWHRYRELDGSNLLVNEKIKKEIEFTRKTEKIERLIQNFKDWSFLLIHSSKKWNESMDILFLTSSPSDIKQNQNNHSDNNKSINLISSIQHLIRSILINSNSFHSYLFYSNKRPQL